MFVQVAGLVLSFAFSVVATPIIYDGRASFNLTAADLDSSTGPYLTVVKGSEAASNYTQLLGSSLAPTPLWQDDVEEQALAVGIDNSSIFVAGGTPQNGFRRTDLIAAVNGVHDANGLIAQMESGTTAFHVSIMSDLARPLNFSHEYQVVFIEPNDGSHVWDIQLGSPFTNPTGTLPAAGAHCFKVRDHAGNVLFKTAFTPATWHNFAVVVDWDALTLAVYYSQDAAPLELVKDTVANTNAVAGSSGQGDFHFTVLKLPIVNPADLTTNQNDVVHFGIQEGTTESLFYSGVFVESTEDGISGVAAA